MFKLSAQSLAKLIGVHPDLVRVVQRAIQITDVDFGVVYGVRTREEEAEMVAKHASTTMHSRHLANKEGYGCAVDLDAFKDGQVDWKDIDLYRDIHTAMMQAANELNVKVEWGGDWTTFKDWGHYQLPWAEYP